MILRVLRAFGNFSEGQIIESNKYGISETTINSYTNSGVVQVVEDYIEKIDIISDNLIYKGKTYSGSLDSDSYWTITKISTVGTQTTKQTFHDVSWANRTNL